MALGASAGNKRTRGRADFRHHLRHSWPVILNLLVIVVLEHVLISALRFGGTPLHLLLSRPVADLVWEGLVWTMFLVAAALLLTGHAAAVPELMVALLGAYTIALGLNVAELAQTLPQRAGADGMTLLIDGALIWCFNVLLFAAWYWLLDGGGYLRRANGDWGRRDFLFPPQAVTLPDYPDWQPNFWDYLFLSFSTSTAFSPTDTQTLSRRAKGLQMLQAFASLVVMTVIVARAINIISSP